MKIHVEVDCTPEEARRAVGLPDLSPVHDRYIAMMIEAMNGAANPEMVDAVLKSWAPMNDAGLAFWRRMFDPGGAGGPPRE